MEGLIKTNLFAYVFSTLLTGFLLWSIIFSMFKKTKNAESKKTKTIICFSVSGILVCLWIWFFICINLFPISLAYYEYSNNFVEEKRGVIESIDQSGKDRIRIVVDGKEYTMVYSSENPTAVIDGDIDEGDTVKIIFGVSSKYIFDIENTRDG